MKKGTNLTLPTVAATASALLTCVAQAGTVEFLITLDGTQETPPVDTKGTGTGTATLDTDTNELTWSIEFKGLTGPATAAHFHGPAPICESAAPEITLTTASPIAGSATLSDQQEADLLGGLWYVNVHTSMHVPGEIRGQVNPVPLDDPIKELVPPSTVHVQLEIVATDLTAPNWGTSAPGIDGRLFVTDQDGILWNIDLATGDKSVFLDVTDRLVPLGIFGPGSFDERGLLGVAFHPDYAKNGLVYTYTSEPADADPDFSTMPLGAPANHQTLILEWTVLDPTNPDATVDITSARELLRIDQPQFNHNGGAVAFGPDGMLYISLGDGGNADDQDTGTDPFGVDVLGHGCGGNGRDNETILGNVLRIDPSGSDSANGEYGIPADNPFVGDDGLDEIYAYGFRNPFRFSFDQMTGEMYVADVGQGEIEEINLVESGGNYGWNFKEGSFNFIENGASGGYVTDMPLDTVPGDLIDPIAEYDHDDGIAVIGGFVYRGDRMPFLEGLYVFGDFAVSFGGDGRLFHLDGDNNVVEFNYVGQKELGFTVLGMGQDADGEVYAMVNDTGTPFDGKKGPTGLVLRLAPKTGDLNGDGVTGPADLAQLLGNWGGRGAADLNMDGVVGPADLALLLGNWG